MWESRHSLLLGKPVQPIPLSASKTTLLPHSRFSHYHHYWTAKRKHPYTYPTMKFTDPCYLSLFSESSLVLPWFPFSSHSDPYGLLRKTLIFFFDTQAAETRHVATSFSFLCNYSDGTCLRRVFNTPLLDTYLKFFSFVACVSKLAVHSALAHCDFASTITSVCWDLIDCLLIPTVTIDNGFSGATRSPPPISTPHWKFCLERPIQLGHRSFLN